MATTDTSTLAQGTDSISHINIHVIVRCSTLPSCKPLITRLIKPVIVHLDIAEDRHGYAEDEASESGHDHNDVTQPFEIATNAKHVQGTVLSLVVTWRNRGVKTTDDRGELHDRQSDEEDQERVVIVNANAVVEPRAVVVEAFHTPVTDGAVAGSWCSEDFAVGT